MLRSPHVNKDSREQFEVSKWAGANGGAGADLVRAPRMQHPASSPRPAPTTSVKAVVAHLNLKGHLKGRRTYLKRHASSSLLTCSPPFPPRCVPQVRLHQRLIDVKDLSSQTVDRLMSLDLPAGVDVEVKL